MEESGRQLEATEQRLRAKDETIRQLQQLLDEAARENKGRRSYPNSLTPGHALLFPPPFPGKDDISGYAHLGLALTSPMCGTEPKENHTSSKGNRSGSSVCDTLSSGDKPKVGGSSTCHRSASRSTPGSGTLSKVEKYNASKGRSRTVSSCSTASPTVLDRHDSPEEFPPPRSVFMEFTLDQSTRTMATPAQKQPSLDKTSPFSSFLVDKPLPKKLSRVKQTKSSLMRLAAKMSPCASRRTSQLPEARNRSNHEKSSSNVNTRNKNRRKSHGTKKLNWDGRLLRKKKRSISNTVTDVDTDVDDCQIVENSELVAEKKTKKRKGVMGMIQRRRSGFRRAFHI